MFLIILAHYSMIFVHYIIVLFFFFWFLFWFPCLLFPVLYAAVNPGIKVAQVKFCYESICFHHRVLHWPILCCQGSLVALSKTLL